MKIHGPVFPVVLFVVVGAVGIMCAPTWLWRAPFVVGFSGILGAFALKINELRYELKVERVYIKALLNTEEADDG